MIRGPKQGIQWRPPTRLRAGLTLGAVTITAKFKQTIEWIKDKGAVPLDTGVDHS